MTGLDEYDDGGGNLNDNDVKLVGKKEQIRQRNEEIRLMYEAGMEPADIAEEVGLSVPMVYTTSRGMGINTRDKTRLEKILDPDTLAALVEEYSSNMDETVVNILRRYGVSFAMWNTYMVRHKIVRRVSAGSTVTMSGVLDVAVAMYTAGAPIWKIKEETGVQYGILNTELHRRGIPLRRAKSWGTGTGTDMNTVGTGHGHGGSDGGAKLLGAFVQGLVVMAFEEEGAEIGNHVRDMANRLLVRYFADMHDID